MVCGGVECDSVQYEIPHSQQQKHYRNEEELDISEYSSGLQLHSLRNGIIPLVIKNLSNDQNIMTNINELFQFGLLSR